MDCGHEIDSRYATELITRQEYQEILEAAYSKATGIPADQCELVEVPFPGGTRWYFRKRVAKKGE
jgi:hypothetical protein